MKQVAYVYDLSEIEKIAYLKEWWSLVNDNGPTIGYTPNATKFVLIVKPELYNIAVELFDGREVIVIEDGQRHCVH